jgi:hypothetical protein
LGRKVVRQAGGVFGRLRLDSGERALGLSYMKALCG